jgi:hypothetical protein
MKIPANNFYAFEKVSSFLELIKPFAVETQFLTLLTPNSSIHTILDVRYPKPNRINYVLVIQY